MGTYSFLVSAGAVTLAGVVLGALWQILRFKRYDTCDVSGYDLATIEPKLTDADAIEMCKATRGCNTVFQWNSRSPNGATVLKGIPRYQLGRNADSTDYSLSTNFMDGSFFGPKRSQPE
jgi:hypothetical protein